jgi:hypothetical protein
MANYTQRRMQPGFDPQAIKPSDLYSKDIRADEVNVAPGLGNAQANSDYFDAMQLEEMPLPPTRNNASYQYGLADDPWLKLEQQKQEQAKKTAQQSQVASAFNSAGQSQSYAGLGASLGGAFGGTPGAIAGGGAGLALDLVTKYYDAKKQKRLQEEQRMIQKKMERIENAERLRTRQISNYEMGMRASDKELADRAYNEAQALKFRQALNNIANQKMAAQGINIFGENGYRTSDFGMTRVNPNRAYGLADKAGAEVVRM